MARSTSQNRLLRDHAPSRTDLLIRVLDGAHPFVVEIFKFCSEYVGPMKKAEPTPGYLHNVNALLEQFQFTPYLGRFDPKKRDFGVHWRPSHPAYLRDDAKLASEPAAAVKIILDMASSGSLDRVRQCLCGKWFVAQSNKKMVCSDACRFRKFKEDHQDTFNEDRKEYMRDYRAVLKKPKVKQKRRSNNAKAK